MNMLLEVLSVNEARALTTQSLYRDPNPTNRHAHPTLVTHHSGAKRPLNTVSITTPIIQVPLTGVNTKPSNMKLVIVV